MNAPMTQPRSIAAMTRLSIDLNDRVEILVKERGYRSKSNFLEEAARYYVRFCEQQNLAGLPLAESPQTQN